MVGENNNTIVLKTRHKSKEIIFWILGLKAPTPEGLFKTTQYSGKCPKSVQMGYAVPYARLLCIIYPQYVISAFLYIHFSSICTWAGCTGTL